MRKFLKKISTSILVFVLSISLTFSSTAATTYQAAAIPVAYTAWEVLVAMLAVLGVTLCAAQDHVDTQLESEMAEDLIVSIEQWKKDHGKGDDKEPFDPLRYVSGGMLKMTDDLISDLQGFIASRQWEANSKPISDVNLYGCSQEEYIQYLCEMTGLKSTDTYLNKFVELTYPGFKNANYSCLFIPGSYTYFFPLSFTQKYGFREYGPKDQTVIRFYKYSGTAINGSGNDGTVWNKYLLRYSNGLGKSAQTDASCPAEYKFNYIFLLNGQEYDFKSIFTAPINTSSSVNDWGTVMSLSDLKAPTNQFGENTSSSINQIGDTALSDMVITGDFDVIGNGREYDHEKQEAVGDLVVPMPSQDVLQGYQNGTVTYEELLEKMEATPIQESTGTNLLTNELISTQTNISSGVDSVVDFLQKIWAWINNFLDSLIQALIDMLMSLILPADGFIEAEIGKISTKLNSMGVAPYDMSGVFETDDENPFKNITVNIYGQEVVIVSFDYLPQFIDKFRPVIRGLLVLFMIFYSINQFLSLFNLIGVNQGGNNNMLQENSKTLSLVDKGGK